LEKAGWSDPAPGLSLTKKILKFFLKIFFGAPDRLENYFNGEHACDKFSRGGTLRAQNPSEQGLKLVATVDHEVLLTASG